MKKKKRTIIITVVVILVVALAIGFSLMGKGGAGGGTLVRLAHPEKGSLIQYVNAPGRIEPQEKVDIRSRISARVVRLPHVEGDWVYMGDPNQDPPVEPSVLIELDSKDVTAQLQAAQIRRKARAARITASQAELEGRKAAFKGQRSVLKQARRELQRKKSLLESRDVSQSSMDQQQSTVDNLEAQLIVSEQGLKSADLNLVAAGRELEAADADIDQVLERVKYTRITAPMDGIIIKLNAEVGEMATGSQYNPGPVLVKVADLSKMILVARVDETDISIVKEGQNANVHIHAYPDRVFEGKVVSTGLDLTWGQGGEKYFEVEVLLDNSKREIYSGLAADVDIEVNIYRDISKIPSHAIVDYETDLLPKDIREKSADVDKSKILSAVVFRHIEGKAIVTPVTFGTSDSTHTIIKSGVSQDDAIVVGPFKVLEGLRHLQKIKKEEDMSEEEEQANLERLGRPKEPQSIGEAMQQGRRK
ncbi:MAG: efflux RND transporter periplasmic adaptor subunit [Desulfobacterales bacterium]